MGVGARAYVDVGASVDEDFPRLLRQRAAVVEGVVGTDKLVLGQGVEQRRRLRALELGRDAQSELARQGPVVAIDAREHAQCHKLVGGGEIFLLQALEILRPLMGPIAGIGRAGGMDSAHAAVDQRLDRRIGVVGAARIMRIVDHAGNARVDAADGRQVVGGIVVLRPVSLGKGKMRRIAVVGKRRRIGIDAAQRRFPGMAVAIDKARHNDGVVRIDHLSVRGSERRRNGGDLLALDQHVALHKVADLGIHADDGAAFEQNTVSRIGRRWALETAQIFCRIRSGETAAGGHSGRQCGASLQRTTSGEGHVVLHLCESSVRGLETWKNPSADFDRLR